MFAVIFEVNPKPEQWDAYLGYAKMLRPELEQIDGFIDNERFSSLRRKGWLLSLSTWRDEKAVIRWRTRARHHEVQQQGRTEVFGDYHLRVGEIIADNRLPAGQVLREQRFDETEAAAKLIGLSEAAPGGLFESIVEPGKFILLASWRDGAAVKGSPQSGSDIRHRRVRVIRDYGMFDRAEAPQYYPPVPRERRGS
jgi:heme-degrading monooxygenase HmoA